MKNLQKMGGLAALYEAVAYLTGIVYFLFVVNYPSIVDIDQKMAFLRKHPTGLFITTFGMYVIFGLVLIVLALALYERLKAGALAVMQTATAVGIIWAGALIASGMVYNAGLAQVVELAATDLAQAKTVWLAIEPVSQGLSCANGEILGGVWTLLVSWAALRTGRLPKALNYLGIAVGIVGLISTIPGLHDLAGVFGMSQLVWFVWLGIVMLRSRPDAA